MSKIYNNIKSNKKRKRTTLKFLLYVLIFITLIGVGFWIQLQINNMKSQKELIWPNSKNTTFGIDVSQYQGNINWAQVKTHPEPISFVFIRASMGKDGIDATFAKNWAEAKSSGIIRGAYHYYRPNENSSLQFDNFAQRVTIQSGDLPPVLDIERESQFGIENLRHGLKNWLNLAESHFGVKPIIYSGRAFYLHHLKGHFDEYTFWIADYSNTNSMQKLPLIIHQFSQQHKVNGINHPVDGNYFKGGKEELMALCLPQNF